MVIIGTGGHLLDLLITLNKNFKSAIDQEQLVIFNDLEDPKIPKAIKSWTLITSKTELQEHFKTDPSFHVAIGNVALRKKLIEEGKQLGGNPTTIIDESVICSKVDSKIGMGVNILPFSLVSSETSIGDGVLINARCNIHHEVEIGEYSVLSPNCVLLGASKIGKECFLGSGVIVFPGVSIGDKAVISAGVVVRKNVPAGKTFFG